MTTATGEFALNFAPLGDQNPWSNANFTVRNGGTSRIASGLLRPNATNIFAYTGGTYDGGSITVSAEINATGDDDEVLLGALDQNGDGFMLRVRATAVIVLVYDNYVVVDSFGSGSATLVADDLYAFTVTKGSPNSVSATRNGSPITLSASTYSLALGTLEAVWSPKAENVGTAAIKSLAVVDGLVVGGGAYTLTADAGSYTLIGQDAYVAIEMNADQGSYSLSGQDASLTKPGLTLTAASGTYNLTGFDALRHLTMLAVAGSYTLTGQAANLTPARKLVSDFGSYQLIGRNATLLDNGVPDAGGSGQRVLMGRHFYGWRLSR